MDKKTPKKIDFLKITKAEQEALLKKALQKGQEEQKKMEKKYIQTILRGACA